MLLHGWPYTWFEWRRLMPLLAEQGHTVIVPDLRGTGHSARPEEGYAKSNVAKDVHDLVAGLGHDAILLFGVDIGMMVAYSYAALYPGEVRRLMLGESLIPGFGLAELMNPATGGYWHFGFHMQLDVASMLANGNEEAYLTPMWSMMSTTGGGDDDPREEFLRYYRSPGGMRGGFHHYATLLDDGRENRARPTSTLAMPVLALNGKFGIPQHQTVDGVRRVATEPEVDLVPGAGHALAEDNPAWLAQRLRELFG